MARRHPTFDHHKVWLVVCLCVLFVAMFPFGAWRFVDHVACLDGSPAVFTVPGRVIAVTSFGAG